MTKRTTTIKRKRAANGDCYEVAAKLVTFDPTYADATLCHGQVWHDDVGWHGHAWVEVERTLDFEGHPFAFHDCVDKANGNDVTLPRALYYKLGRIDPALVVRYDAEAAALHVVTNHHWGPWDE